MHDESHSNFIKPKSALYLTLNLMTLMSQVTYHVHTGSDQHPTTDQSMKLIILYSMLMRYT